MRPKRERTVKSSPIKKAETPTRRTSRRTRKSPEKVTIAEEDSENSSDQASSSENETEEVVAPKRSRRTSRTIEKSSSAEEIKATTTATPRSRRRTAVKKDADIQEEEADAEQVVVPDEPKESESVVETTEKVESIDVDSSTEPVTTAADVVAVADSESKAQLENSNSIESNDTEKSIATDEQEQNKKDEVEIIEQSAEIASAAEPLKSISVESVGTSKSRRRTLKRIDKESHSDAQANVFVTDEPSSMNTENQEELNNSEAKSNSEINVELQNGNNQNDAADTTAKDTTASETDSTTKISKKKPIVRKRKWLTNKTAAPKLQEIAISTDSLKGLISDVKPVPLSDVQLDSSPEIDHDSDDVKVVSSTSIDYNRRSEDRQFEGGDDANAINISTSRKISIVTESEGEQPLSPAKHNPCNILFITNLVRPFTVLQLKSLLQRTGKIVEDGFWIDKIKSKCFVKYETEDEAIETRHALHGIRWPTSNPKCLNVDFGTESLMEKAMAEVKPSPPARDDRIVSSNELQDSARERAPAVDRPVREWDLGKKDSHRPREAERAERDKEREQKPARASERDRRRRSGSASPQRDSGRDRRRRSTSASPSRKYTKKDNEPPLRLLDDLFRKTKTTPCIYWLPLTPEQIAVRIEERKKAIERREAMRKDMEREEAEERNRRREREKRREESRERRDRERDRNRDRDRDRDRHRDDRGSSKRRRY